jgi:hypothetical protein
LRVSLRTVNSLAVDSAGRLLIADGGSFLVRRVDRDGTMSTVAGTGVYCRGDCSKSDSIATQTPLSHPSFVTAGHDGSVWFTVGRALYRVSATGALRLMFFPDTNQPLSAPAVDRAGNVLVGYWPAGVPARLVRISPSGTITKLLGRESGCNVLREALQCGDGSLASTAGVGRQIYSVAIAPSGDVYFSDVGGEVRYISAQGAGRTGRLALAIAGSTSVRAGGTLRIGIRTTAPSTISLLVASRGPADITGQTHHAVHGAVYWTGRVHDKQLPPGDYTLKVTATDARGRGATRILPLHVTR